MLRIAHCAPFAPNACGLYEAARDFVKADRMAGRVAELVDTGRSNGAEHMPARPGEKDSRGGCEIVARTFDECADFDLFMLHDGVPDAWLASNFTPTVLVLHGRPKACFGPEQWGRGGGYSFAMALGQRARTRKILTMWREFVPYWQPVLPQGKLVCTDDPPIDCDMYTPEGAHWPIPLAQRGEWDILIADSWREDVDVYEVAHGCLEAARLVPGLKVHFFGVECDKARKPIGGWDYIFGALRSAGVLGCVNDRMAGNLAELYRAMDVVVSPHRIGVRIIGESLACGTPVVADAGCRYTPYTADVDDPLMFGAAIARCITDLKDDEAGVRARARIVANACFNLTKFGEKLGALYDAALKEK